MTKISSFFQDFIDIVLKTGQSISEFKRHDLVFKMAIFSIKNSLPFIAFSNSHSVIDISQVQLGKMLGLT